MGAAGEEGLLFVSASSERRAAKMSSNGFPWQAVKVTPAIGED